MPIPTQVVEASSLADYLARIGENGRPLKVFGETIPEKDIKNAVSALSRWGAVAGRGMKKLSLTNRGWRLLRLTQMEKGSQS